MTRQIGTALLALAAVATLSLAACEQQSRDKTAAPEATAPSAAASFALTPDGWGPLQIGMTRDEVIAAMGGPADPDALATDDPAVCDVFRPARAPEGLVVLLEDGRLGRVSIGGDSTLRTDTGFGLDATPTEIKAAFGSAAFVSPHKYFERGEDIFVWRGGPPAGEFVQDPAARGVRFETDDDGKVTQIHVGGPSIQFVEGCL